MPLPQLFILGDSISMQYGPYLAKMVEGRYEVARKTGEEPAAKSLGQGANGGNSQACLEYLQAMLAPRDFAPDFLLLNCGLHDILTNPATHERRVDLTDYQANLRAIVALLKPSGIRPIWVRTTPVVDAIHNANKSDAHRHARDQATYNAAADQIMSSADIPLLDLCTFTHNLGQPETLFCDHVHFTERVRELQAAFIAGFMAAAFHD